MEDTIAAISTPPGEGGIGIIRISGKKAFDIGKEIFSPSGGQPEKMEPRKVYYGNITTREKILDEVLVTFMKGPRSYTTQDVVEINSHGGPLILKKILELVLNKGARLAEPGEFTKRAFLGGRIDLTQAEAVMDMIRAKTDQAREMAISQLKGEFGELMSRFRDRLLDFMLQLEVRIDFCED
ncbi:MAG: tRNA uridine-5-carboxymethylaminomethyl(34) synthesis GTPase MnmE, partial [Vulcanimicrobiota bacterium]